MRIAALVLVLLACCASAAQATDPPIVGQRKVTLRVHDTTMHAQTAPLRGTVAAVAFYVDGKAYATPGTGSDCRKDYTTQGLVIRLNACGEGGIKVAVANASGKPHRVTVRFWFVA